MKRLHLVTSRAPLAGAVNAGDTLIFMDAGAARDLMDKVLSDDPRISRKDLRVIKQDKGWANIGLEAIDYKELVELAAAGDSVVSW